MEWIGFIALALVGLWLCFMGLGACLLGGMFGGRVGAEGLILLIGAAILFAAFKFAPFSIVIN